MSSLQIPINRYCLHCNKLLYNINNDWSNRRYHKVCYKIINSVDYYKEISIDIREQQEQDKKDKDKNEINDILLSWGHSQQESNNIVNNLYKYI